MRSNLVVSILAVVLLAQQSTSALAQRHSRHLVHDLRIAFSAVSKRRYSNDAVSTQQVLYCKNLRLGSGLQSASTGHMVTAQSSSSTALALSPTPATSTSSNGLPASTTIPASSTSVAGDPAWTLVQTYTGSTFFDGWQFWDSAIDGPDPTGGAVDYVNQAEAQMAGLIEINDAGNAVIRVETTPSVASNRKSIRITTQMSFTGGLVIMDSLHMPAGCGTWPAFWSTGPNWPAGGEIDVVEGVNDVLENQSTIHTSQGCTLPSSDPAQLNTTAAVVTADLNCVANLTETAGCWMQSGSNVSFGAGFNSIGGGVYAMKWDSEGISVWFFPRSIIPWDISSDNPVPDSWGLPVAHWPASTCNPEQYFSAHSAIFDISLCGQWAGTVWGTNCATLTGFPTCEAFVAQQGVSFIEAYWEVKSLKFFNLTSVF
ncbi:unnamed protein product [Mycena citricolor]|uniref:GH16 domain-containing protein n=1 Tax=Mycena citricolor TaxID=2018698 RepID=A0AAD2Q0W6_9AGAR|nr:unnamed protein product [Mycena citricolor]